MSRWILTLIPLCCCCTLSRSCCNHVLGVDIITIHSSLCGCIAGLKELRSKMNIRARDLILGWLKEKGLAPDAQSDLGKQGLGHKKQRRSLLSPLWLLAHAFHQQQGEQGSL